MFTTAKPRFLAAVLAVMAGTAAYALAADAPTGKTPMADPSKDAVATFAGGCFWCVESGFEKIPGVVTAISGYSGGPVANPTYSQVSAGSTGHAESVQVTYDPTAITYEGLLQGFWRLIDPTDGDGSFVDRGNQYRPVIFYHNAEQKAEAEQSLAALAKSGRYGDKPMKVQIVPFEIFYPAEDYHQDYYKKNPVRYEFYSFNSGRFQYVKQIWGDDLKVDYTMYRPKEAKMDTHMDAPKDAKMDASKDVMYARPSDAEIKQKLTALQYSVTQKDDTEPPFRNTYWDNHKPGIYVDVVTGEPLFSSTDKYESGTGWPSFTKPISPDSVVTKTDTSFFSTRTEVRSRIGNSHLGHVFDDGPKPTGLRYCMNSAALRFVPVQDLAKDGYGQYASLFDAKPGDTSMAKK